MSTITIGTRYRGPVGMGNGGYVCGMLAGHLAEVPGSSVQVKLRAPSPLDKALQVEVDGEQAVMKDGDQLIAVAEAGLPPIDTVPPAIPDMPAADDATSRFIVHDDEMYLQCFVCGKKRGDDALHIHAGELLGEPHMVASPWTPADDYAGDDGFVRDEIIWAALDCPGFFACSATERTLLASMQLQMLDRLRPGEACRIVGWDKAEGAREGRKRLAGTALIGADNRIIAASDQLWIVLKDQV